jgi:hypothetical protein
MIFTYFTLIYILFFDYVFSYLIVIYYLLIFILLYNISGVLFFNPKLSLKKFNLFTTRKTVWAAYELLYYSFFNKNLSWKPLFKKSSYFGNYLSNKSGKWF